VSYSHYLNITIKKLIFHKTKLKLTIKVPQFLIDRNNTFKK
jgi:hypothetical protein